MYRQKRTLRSPILRKRLVIMRRRQRALHEAIRWLEIYKRLSRTTHESALEALQKYLRFN